METLFYYHRKILMTHKLYQYFKKFSLTFNAFLGWSKCGQAHMYDWLQITSTQICQLAKYYKNIKEMLEVSPSYMLVTTTPNYSYVVQATFNT